MYTPKNNVMSDREEITDFMKNFSFATIITADNDVPTATQLPFVVEVGKGKYHTLFTFRQSKSSMAKPRTKRDIGDIQRATRLYFGR